MKIRNGLVSNSSSSSFIISIKKYMSTLQIADEMITIINETDQEYSSYKNFNIYNKFKNVNNLDNINPNIKLHTSGYDTYITYLPNSKYYLISTSSNYNWEFNYLIENDFTKKIQDVKNELKNNCSNYELDQIEDVEDLGDIFPTLDWYWDCKLNLIIKAIKYIDYNKDYCKNHGSYKFNILNENNIYCPECYLEQLKFKESIKNNPKFIFNIRK